MLTVGITSAGSGVGSAVLRSLSLAALDTRVVCLDGAPDATGVHRGHRGRVVPRVTHPEYAEAILRVCAEEGIQALIPGLDTELEPLALMADRLKAIGCELVCTSVDSIRLLRDKQRCSEYFQQFGLPFIKTLPISRAEELLDTEGFPLLVKPLGGSGSRGVHIVFSLAELKKLMEEGESYVVQNYLLPLAWGKRKRDLTMADVYSNHSLVQRDEHMVQVLTDRDGSTFGVMASINALKDGAISRMRPVPPEATSTTAVALNMAAQLATLGLVGPCNFQSRVTAEGPFIYEINPRFSGGTGGRASLGFNEVEACLRRLVLGQSVEAAQACLNTRFDEVCAWHPAELVMKTSDVQDLKAGGGITGQMPQRAQMVPSHAL